MKGSSVNMFKSYVKDTYLFYIFLAFLISCSENQTSNEISLKLEQLRALDNNIQIDVVFANSKPIGVDTNEDFLEIKKLMEYKS